MAMSFLEGLASSSLATTSVILIASWLLYLISLVASRLYFSPLAKFPGPKSAALSRWYEFYYEVVLKGKFSQKIDELHNQYGKTMTHLTCFKHFARRFEGANKVF